jgi:hypothetical protein
LAPLQSRIDGRILYAVSSKGENEHVSKIRFSVWNLEQYSTAGKG